MSALTQSYHVFLACILSCSSSPNHHHLLPAAAAAAAGRVSHQTFITVCLIVELLIVIDLFQLDCSPDAWTTARLWRFYHVDCSIHQTLELLHVFDSSTTWIDLFISAWTTACLWRFYHVDCSIHQTLELLHVFDSSTTWIVLFTRRLNYCTSLTLLPRGLICSSDAWTTARLWRCFYHVDCSVHQTFEVVALLFSPLIFISVSSTVVWCVLLGDG